MYKLNLLPSSILSFLIKEEDKNINVRCTLIDCKLLNGSLVAASEPKLSTKTLMLANEAFVMAINHHQPIQNASLDTSRSTFVFEVDENETLIVGFDENSEPIYTFSNNDIPDEYRKKMETEAGLVIVNLTS